MTWASLKSTGRGRVCYAIVIAGWPEIFVTDPSMTLATGANGRTVIPGLLTDGLEFSERLIPQDGITEGSSMTFQLRSPTRADECMQSFTDFGTPAAEVSADLTVAATSVTYSGASPLAETPYHIGSETVYTGGTPATISRAQWNTEAEAHKLNYFDQTQPLYFYDRPPTMDGRRVTLYAWGTGDSVTSLSAGTAIWRGVVTQSPQLDSDGVTWIIQADHITALLNQTVVGHDIEAKIVGYYHHRLAPVIVLLRYNGTNSSPYYVEGFHIDHTYLAGAIKLQIDAAIAELSIPSSRVQRLDVTYSDSDGFWTVWLGTGGTAISTFSVYIGSSLIGLTNTSAFGTSSDWQSTDGQAVRYDALSTNTTYKMPLVASDSTDWGFGPLFNGNPSFPSAALGGPSFLSAWASARGAPLANATSLTASEWRIYVDTDMSAINGQFVMIKGTLSDSPFKVSATGFDATNSAYYIDVEPPPRFGGARRNAFEAYLGTDTTITPLIEYSDDDFAGFLEAVVTRAAEEGNNGIAPYFHLNDFENAGGVPTFTPQNTASLKFTERDYAFHKSVPISDVIRGEMMMLGHILYLNATGQMAFRPLPLFTETTRTSKSITSAEIITPANSYGSWPGYQIQAQGLVNTISVYEGYMPAEDDWRWRFNITDANSIAAHKNRGRGDLDVKIYSSGGTDDMTHNDAAVMVAPLLSFMGKSYAAITVEVPFKCFDYLVGDVVTLTHTLIPDGTGSRGVSNRRAVVVGRRWNLDPAREEMGALTLWMLQDSVAGYCPSAIITGQVNDSGNTWTITCSSANAINIELSTNGDGKVLEHLAVGDYVAASERDDAAPVNRSGVVDSIDTANDTVTVTFTTTWTPGSSSWSLEFQTDSGSTVTTNQRPFAYVADSNRQLTTGSFAHRFA